MERGLGERVIVEGPQCHCIGWCVGVDSAQQQPGEQREQQRKPEDARQIPHRNVGPARDVAVAGRTN